MEVVIFSCVVPLRKEYRKRVKS